MKTNRPLAVVWLLALMPLMSGFILAADSPATVVKIDANADRHEIDPRIYGLAFATEAQLKDLNVSLNRWGGNTTTRYNWKLDCDNRGADWFFQSIASSEGPLVPGKAADSFIASTQAAEATPMITIPLIDWVGKVGADRTQKLWSFSRKKYGDQQQYDTWNADSGNGLKSNGKTPVTGNAPADANLRNSVELQREWIKHLKDKWGPASPTKPRYYLLDNESSLWHSTHRDVHPKPPAMDEIRDKLITFAEMIRSADPEGLIVGPEEWGWTNYFHSAADSDWRSKNNWRQDSPDRAAHGNQDYVPYLLAEMKKAGESKKKRLIDVLSVHYYPAGIDTGDNPNVEAQQKRNRSTRSLWDPNYKDESWVNDFVQMVPRLKKWAAAYPGTLTGITEYNWGAEKHISGATAQADVLGIFGRESLDLATRWTTPETNSPAYLAIKIYRNYDGNRSTFGDQSVRTNVEQPDQLAAFAAVRKSDQALTIMVINKINQQTPVTLSLSNFPASASAQRWQLTGPSIDKQPDITVQGDKIEFAAPGPSITLIVLPKK